MGTQACKAEGECYSSTDRVYFIVFTLSVYITNVLAHEIGGILLRLFLAMFCCKTSADIVPIFLANTVDICGQFVTQLSKRQK